MVFDYYRRLSRADRRIYNESDRIPAIRLPLRNDDACRYVETIAQALSKEDQRGVQKATDRLCQVVCECLGTPPVRVKVLARRPSDDWGELYGLYEGREGRRRAVITLWMRTAHKRQVVAFKTYLRTVLHELCHHIDYEYLKLEDSFHTQGFYRREASLYRQLVTQSRQSTAVKPTRKRPPAPAPISQQQELF